MLGNLVIETFTRGGWVMWPVLLVFFLAVCVLLDRLLWWVQLKRSLRPQDQERARDALGRGDFGAAWRTGEGHGDPFLANLREGLSHARTSMLAAMQMHASHLIERSEARLWVLSTVITLAPLLGLLGTVAGIMRSFNFVGDEQLAPTKVSGGIAEALIATACGLAIAIVCLLPYNFFRKRVSSLRSALERWINHAELLVQSAKAHGHDVEEFVVPSTASRAD